MAADTWLTLGQASRRLGVHPSTLRSWADAGEVSAFRTPGGHRRFRASDIDTLLSQASNTPRPPAPFESREYQVLIQHVRHDLSQLPASRAGWFSAFDEAEHQILRESGRRLLGLAIQYAARRNSRVHVTDEARAIGLRYGKVSAQHRVQLPDLFRACLFFRDAVLQAAAPDAHMLGAEDVEGARIRNDLTTFLTEVICAVAEGYGTACAGPALGS
jgi:excisionase family DNA binding protein